MMKKVCFLFLLISLVSLSLHAMKNDDYKNFKDDFEKAEKKGDDKAVEFLVKNTKPEDLKLAFLKDDFYKDIFSPLVNRLLADKKIDSEYLKLTDLEKTVAAVSLESMINRLQGLNKKEQESVAKNMAQVFYTIFQDTKLKDQEFDIAYPLIYSDLGNNILREWLKLDEKLPFVTGTITKHYYFPHVSTLNLFQKMLMEYALKDFKFSYLNVSKTDDVTMKAFVQAWEKGDQKEKNYIADIQNTEPTNAEFVSGRWVGKGTFTAPELVKEINLVEDKQLGTLFEEFQVKNRPVIDQFASALADI